MSKELVISATPHETRVAIVEDGQLCEIYIEREKEFALVGSLYKGRVTRVLPGMQSSFVDIGLDSDAFLYVTDFLENLEDYDHVVPAVKVQNPSAQPGRVFSPATTGADAPESATGLPSSAEGEHHAEPYADHHDEIRPEPANDREPGNESIGESTHEPGNSSSDSAAYASSEAGHSSQPAAYTSAPSSNAPRPAAPFQRPPRPYEQRPGGGRGGDRGGRGGGRNRRWGKPGGGGRDRRPGRDLPSSKYASPRGPDTRTDTRDSRPRETTPYEPPPADYVPIILPGESLAKYKNLSPTGQSAPSSAPPAPGTTSAEAHPSPVTPDTATTPDNPQIENAHTGDVRSQSGSLPVSLYATPPAAIPLQNEPTLLESVIPDTTAQDPTVAEPQTLPPASTFTDTPGYSVAETNREGSWQPQETSSSRMMDEVPELGIDAEPPTHVESPLSEDELTAFAEQITEVKHEQAHSDIEQRVEVEEAAAVPFVEEAELEELEDALHEDGVHEDDVEDSETADAAHDEAMASESSLQDENVAHETGNVEESPRSTESQPSTARISEQPRARFQRPMRRGGRPRGGRRGPSDHRSHQHSQRPQQQRRPQLISEMLKAGQEIIVQIAKEPLGKKGARITSHVALPGRFLVYMPTVDHIGVSHRIGSAEDRSRLRRVVTEAKGTFPGGFIVRTAAAGATDDEIRTDVEFLGRTWDTIRASAEQRHAPALLHRDLNLVERILRDYLSDDYVAIWIDNEEEYSKVVEFVGRFQPRMAGRVKLYTKDSPIFEEFGIQQDLDKALRPKVWLKSGGYIVINHTEALVAIDVNTGKFVGRGSTRLEDTIVKTNLEAVKEIVRQIRLRDLGGIIVVDFIDMEERRNREKVLYALEQALSQDRAPSKALAFNEFGLVCITRKRTKQALERVLCQPCPYCTGSGMVKSIPTICYEIQAEARKMAADIDARSLTLRVNPEIAKALKTRESSLIEELEQATRKSAIIQSDPTLHWEQYDIY